MKWLVSGGLLMAGLTVMSSMAVVAGAATQPVSVQDNQFVDGTSGNGTTTITAGDSVQWTWSGSNPHTVDSNGGGETFSSGEQQTSGTFSHTFSTPGTYNYICGVHGTSMQGTVIVNAGAVATDTPAPQPSSTPVPEPTNTPQTTNTAGPTVASTPVPAGTAIAPTNTPATAATGATPRPAGAALPAAGSGGSSGDAWPRSAAALAVVVGLLGIAGAAMARWRRTA